MESYIQWMDEQPAVIKLLLCIWILDITWAVYRIGRAIIRGNMLHLVLGILWVLFAGIIGWLLDVVSIVLMDRIFWFVED